MTREQYITALRRLADGPAVSDEEAEASWTIFSACERGETPPSYGPSNKSWWECVTHEPVQEHPIVKPSPKPKKVEPVDASDQSALDW